MYPTYYVPMGWFSRKVFEDQHKVFEDQHTVVFCCFPCFWLCFGFIFLSDAAHLVFIFDFVSIIVETSLLLYL